MARPNKVSVKVARRSGFDKSHVHQGTSSAGVITPIMIDEVIPNSKVNLRLSIGASMPPLASDTYMKCDLAVEAFFIPLRLCYGGFESFFCQRTDRFIAPEGQYTQSPIKEYVPNVPGAHLHFDYPKMRNHFGVRSLSDFLGWSYAQGNTSDVIINPMPFVAYHLVWQHYYRQSLVQKECFARPSFSDLDQGVIGDMAKPYTAALLPYLTVPDGNLTIGNYDTDDAQEECWLLADGVSLFSLRNRNYDFDYFTNAFPTSQLGDEMRVNINEYSNFTIASLRAANALQEFSEKNQLAGVKFADTLKSRYGASLANGVANRPICLGSARYNIYNKGVNVTGNNGGYSSGPYWVDQAGAVLGNAYASGSDFLIDGFVADEPGYILVNCTLVPTATYAYAMDRLFTRYIRGAASITDMAIADLQGTGNDPIYEFELTSAVGSHALNPETSAIFGYTDKYASWMVKHDRVSGLFHEGLSLSSMVLQRDTPGGQQNWRINDTFLRIPGNALDNVLLVSSDGEHRFGYWFEAAFDYKVSMPLAEYSLPSISNPAKEHGETVSIHRGGFRF